MKNQIFKKNFFSFQTFNTIFRGQDKLGRDILVKYIATIKVRVNYYLSCYRGVDWVVEN